MKSTVLRHLRPVRFAWIPVQTDGVGSVRRRPIILRHCESIRMTTGNLHLIHTPKFLSQFAHCNWPMPLPLTIRSFMKNRCGPRTAMRGRVCVRKCRFRWQRVSLCTRSLSFWICCRKMAQILFSQIFVSVVACWRCGRSLRLHRRIMCRWHRIIRWGHWLQRSMSNLQPPRPISKFWNITCPMRTMP